MTTTRQFDRDTDRTRVIDLLIPAIAAQQAIIDADPGYTAPATHAALVTREGIAHGLRSILITDLTEVLWQVTPEDAEDDPHGALARLEDWRDRPEHGDALRDAAYVQGLIWEITGGERDRATLLALDPTAELKDRAPLSDAVDPHVYVARFLPPIVSYAERMPDYGASA